MTDDRLEHYRRNATSHQRSNDDAGQFLSWVVAGFLFSNLIDSMRGSGVRGVIYGMASFVFGLVLCFVGVPLLIIGLAKLL